MKRTAAIGITLFCAQIVAAQPRSVHFPSQIQVERLRGTLGATPSNLAPLPLSQLSLELIKNFEGWSPVPYDDSAGYCTIGYGHLLALQRCADVDIQTYRNGITETDGGALLDQDTRLARLAVQKGLSRSLSPDQFGALTSFVFNVGSNNFRTSHLRQFTQLGQDTLAAREFGRWVKAGGAVQNGLVIRRKCEANLFLSRLRAKENGSIDRRSCVALGVVGAGSESVDIYRGETR